MSMKRYIVRQLTANKGQPRVYLDIVAMADAGFEPGKTYVRAIDEVKHRITLTVQNNGTHVVCKKEKDDRTIPVIDINSASALNVFNGMTAVRIVLSENTIEILPLASEVKRIERLDRLKRNMDAGEVTTAGVSYGGGTLDHAAHTGLKNAGVNPRLVMANEIDEGLLDHAIAHNDAWHKDAMAIAAPLQELVQDEAAMHRVPRADILIAGIPCSGASQAGKSKKGLAMMEEHEVVGHLAASFLMVLQRINPSLVVLENVEQYATSASAQILRHHLRDCGYDVQETVLQSKQFGCLENRNRWVMLAATRGLAIDLQDLAPKLVPARMLAEYLEPIGPDAADWRTFDYLKSKEIRDAGKGNSFAMQVVTPNDTSVPVLRKGYAKGGSTDPLLCHPTDPDLLRQLTVTEHARIKQQPEHLVAGLSKTDGHILLGQGVAAGPFKALFQRIGECLLEWRSSIQNNGIQHLGYSLKLATG